MKNMRTKALFCAAALAATSLAASAQTYSLNVVGYINNYITNGYNLFANHLDLDGTMTNNTLQTVLGTNFPVLTKAIAYTPANGWLTAQYLGNNNWNGQTNAANTALTPGKGLFIFLAAGKAPVTLTTVGQVIQGTNYIALPTGYNIVSSTAPIGGDLKTVIGLNGAHTLDKVLEFQNPGPGWVTHQWVSGAWSPAATINVGSAFFYKPFSAAGTWTNIFVAQ
jgi:hypothetical protein